MPLPGFFYTIFLPVVQPCSGFLTVWNVLSLPLRGFCISREKPVILIEGFAKKEVRAMGFFGRARESVPPHPRKEPRYDLP